MYTFTECAADDRLTKAATAANWRAGFPTIIPPPQTVNDTMQRLDSGDKCMGWYLCYNQPKQFR